MLNKQQWNKQEKKNVKNDENVLKIFEISK